MTRRLVVLAGDGPVGPSDDGDSTRFVLPLADEAARVGALPPDALAAADAAAECVRRELPAFLWRFVRERGVLDLADAGGVSWWWYTPLSEKSALRSPLVNELYRLELLRELLDRGDYDVVEWHGDDPVMAAAAEAVSHLGGARFSGSVSGGGGRARLARLATRRVAYLGWAVARWAILRALGAAQRPPAGADCILFTRFPVLWDGQRERMFGTWPAHLRARGHRVAWAALVSAGPLELLARRSELRALEHDEGLVALEGALPLRQLLRAHLSVGVLGRYLRLRRARRRERVVFDGLDVTALVWRELDASAFATELALDRTTAAALREILASLPSARAVFLPFEYQPMERAVRVGAGSAQRVTVVGLQTGLFTSNHMGFTFLPEEVRGVDGAPLPDVLAAYGELPHRLWTERLGDERVCLSGPVRYPELAEAHAGGAASRQPTAILVPTPISRAEGASLLRGCFAIASERPELRLLIKFHYHLPLGDEVERLAEEHGVDRYEIVDGELRELMRRAPATVCAGSSVGIEAMVAGSMPVVYRSLGTMSPNPMLDVRDAAFFWRTTDELRAALDSCERRDARYEARVAARDAALRAHVHPLDGHANDRLYGFLSEREMV